VARTRSGHDTGSITARSVDEVALIRHVISHYAPVLIASLSIRIRRADVQKIWMTSVENGPTLQSALDDWDRISPKPADLAEALEEGTARHIFRSIQPNAQVIRPLAQGSSVAPASVRQSDVAWSVFLALYCSSTPTSQHSRGSDSSGLLRLERSSLCCVHVGLTVSSRALGPARSGSHNPSGWSQPYVFMDARSASEGGPNVT
jgi:hypothetical protein